MSDNETVTLVVNCNSLRDKDDVIRAVSGCLGEAVKIYVPQVATYEGHIDSGGHFTPTKDDEDDLFFERMQRAAERYRQRTGKAPEGFE